VSELTREQILDKVDEFAYLTDGVEDWERADIIRTALLAAWKREAWLAAHHTGYTGGLELDPPSPVYVHHEVWAHIAAARLTAAREATEGASDDTL